MIHNTREPNRDLSLSKAIHAPHPIRWQLYLLVQHVLSLSLSLCVCVWVGVCVMFIMFQETDQPKEANAIPDEMPQKHIL